MKRTLNKKLWQIIAGLLFVIILFPAISGGIFSGGDLANNYIPAKYFFKQSLIQNHQLPLWIPNCFGGRPFQADIQTGVFYPLNWLILFFSPERFFTIITLLHIIIGMTGMWKYIRLITKDSFVRSLAAILFAFGSFNTSRLAESSGVVLFIITGAWMPWVLYFEECFYRLRTVKALVYLTVVITLQLLSGSPQIAYYTWLALAVIIVFQILYSRKIRYFQNIRTGSKIISSGKFSGKNKGLVIGLAIAFVLALLLFAVQLFPTYEFISNSFDRARGTGTFEYITEDSFRNSYLPTYLIPYYFNNPADPNVFQMMKTGFHEYNYYGSVALVFFFFLCFFISGKTKRKIEIDLYGSTKTLHRQRISAAWIVIAIAGYILAGGQFSYLFRIFYNYFPGFKSFRVPARLMMFWWFGSIILSALLLDFIIKTKSLLNNQSAKSIKDKMIKHISLSAAGITIVLMIIILLLRSFITYVYNKLGIIDILISQGINPGTEKFHQMFLSLPMKSAYLSILFLACAFLSLILYMSGRIKTKIFQMVIFISIGADLYFFSEGFIFTKSSDLIDKELYKKSELVSFLQSNLKDGERYTWLDNVFGYMCDQNQMELFSNRFVKFGLNDMRGYDPLILARYGQFINMISGRPLNEKQGGFLMGLGPQDGKNIRYELLKLYNLKYLLSYIPINNKEFKVVKKFEFDYESQLQTLYVYETDNPSGRIYFREDTSITHPGKTLNLLEPDFDFAKEAIPEYINEDPEYKKQGAADSGDKPGMEYKAIYDTPDKQKFEIDVKKAGIIVFAENYDPGWKVYLDGVRTDYIPVNHSLGGIFITPGKYKIYKTYRPDSLIRGAFISLAGIIFFLLLISKIRKRPGNHETH